MNREIKFRGKQIDNGEWVYGLLSYGWQPKGMELPPCYIDTMQNYTSEGASIRVFEVEPETVGQYTGLKDKNGKGIYEGDILKHPEADEPEDLGWQVDWLYTEYIFQNVRTNEVYSASRFKDYTHKMEIIRNIYQHKELLDNE